MMNFPLETPYHINSTELPTLGTGWVAANNQGLVAFDFGIPEEDFLTRVFPKGVSASSSTETLTIAHPLTSLALRQVGEYLAGERQHFTLPIDWRQFTVFQADVYRAVIAIPFGDTRTYQQIAAQVNRPRAARAVGAANGANPLPIIIPCHRLVGKDGSLRGYGGKGGIQTKQWLLDHEQQYS
ncbi:MAG TPA: methylated-DNA--[protein]-cysteine S-methyltransferase [Anaerolineales bacterium]|jgi:methylated-DNA-[protein]-cysteine S-methyltransferase|nr:methylated-DNA--[protein]-cysteine S-methyltransferase [Anaerolineales bacterium]